MTRISFTIRGPPDNTKIRIYSSGGNTQHQTISKTQANDMTFTIDVYIKKDDFLIIDTNNNVSFNGRKDYIIKFTDVKFEPPPTLYNSIQIYDSRGIRFYDVNTYDGSFVNDYGYGYNLKNVSNKKITEISFTINGRALNNNEIYIYSNDPSQSRIPWQTIFKKQNGEMTFTINVNVTPGYSLSIDTRQLQYSNRGAYSIKFNNIKFE